jgi:peptidoglycan/LPS O-acetylase OafA/YrhL
LLDPLGLYANGMAISAVTVLTAIVAVLLTTPAAYLSWRLIELPAIAFGKGLYRQRASAPEAV